MPNNRPAAPWHVGRGFGNTPFALSDSSDDPGGRIQCFFLLNDDLSLLLDESASTSSGLGSFWSSKHKLTFASLVISRLLILAMSSPRRESWRTMLDGTSAFRGDDLVFNGLEDEADFRCSWTNTEVNKNECFLFSREGGIPSVKFHCCCHSIEDDSPDEDEDSISKKSSSSGHR